jgi:formate dehydrogenase subunit delta
MKPTTMVHKANQIALFFGAYPHDEAVDGIANHISRYWERRIRNQMEQYVADGGLGVHRLVLEALKRLSTTV